MLRPCVSFLRNVSLTTVKRTFLSNAKDSIYEFPQSSSLLRLNGDRRILRASVKFSTATSSASESTNGQKSEETPAGQQTEKQVEELLKQVEAYKEKVASVEDKYKRQLAETENVRSRFMRQVEEAKSFGIQNFCKDMLEIADVLELATESVPKDLLAKDENAALKQLYDGLIMTQTQLNKIFKKHGLESVRPLGEKFNPNIHEAVFQVKDDTKESGSIANVVKIGYLLHDRLIRPAKVGVYISS